jgi:KDO2-lipid IV(A) lauroyltransferase
MEDRFHESFMKKALNFLFVSLAKVFSHAPFFLLYFFSDIFFLLVGYVFRYRKRVIVSNLKNSFPEKGDKEIAQITRRFYRHFCDLMVESIKLYSMSAKEHLRRVKFYGVDKMIEYGRQGKSVIIIGMHYNNWEWTSILRSLAPMPGIVLYNPVRGNKAFENFMLKSRTRYNTTLIPVHKSSRALIDFVKAGNPKLLGLLADQSPGPNSKLWIRFLNQETSFFSGPEKIALLSGHPVVFQHMVKIGRGRYEVHHYPLFENYEGVESKDILIRYAKKMEEIIKEKPEYYLWSHRRWKRQRPKNVPLLDSE